MDEDTYSTSIDFTRPIVDGMLPLSWLLSKSLQTGYNSSRLIEGVTYFNLDHQIIEKTTPFNKPSLLFRKDTRAQDNK